MQPPSAWQVHRMRLRFFLRHWRHQWRLIGPLGRFLVLFAVFMLVYGFRNIYHGIQKAAEDEGDYDVVKMVVRKRCPIKMEDRVTLPRLYDYTGLNQFSHEELVHSYAFNSEIDTLVFLHIHKTSGVNLLTFLKGVQPQRNTLFSTDVTMHRAASCQQHMDFALLQRCLADSTGAHKRPLVMTMLRDPLHRYLSEWLHLSSGDAWLPMYTWCSGSCPQCAEVQAPRCLLDTPLAEAYLHAEHQRLKAAKKLVKKNFSLRDMLKTNVSIVLQRWQTRDLNDFLSCADNPANNRQVRMLGNYDVINEHCRNFDLLSPREVAENLLRTAKGNLKEMAFFGLAEYQRESQDLFHKTFGLPKLGDMKLVQSRQNHVACLELDEAIKEKVRDLNSVDYQLYDFAKDLFFQRLKAAGLNYDKV